MLDVVSTCLGHVIDMSRLFYMSVSTCLSLRSIELSSYRDVLFPTISYETNKLASTMQLKNLSPTSWD